MSRTYDAKQTALLAYPDDKEAAVVLFLEYLNTSASDFKYEENQTAEEYLFSKSSSQGVKGGSMSETERWRAIPGNYFWFMRDGEAVIWRDKRGPFENRMFKEGNYYMWKKEALAA